MSSVNPPPQTRFPHRSHGSSEIYARSCAGSVTIHSAAVS
jgi:hypothetical protein